MDLLELTGIMLIYGVLIWYFIVPFHLRTWKQETSYLTKLKEMISHKKAIGALLLLVFSLVVIWFSYEAMEFHVNEHSGYPPVQMKWQALLPMSGLVIYTAGLIFLFGSLRLRNR